MITGTIGASTPKNPNFLLMALYAVPGLCFVLRPIAISVVINVKPKVSARMIYTRIDTIQYIELVVDT